jgi:hypothetical protein
LARSAASGEIRAAAICADVRITPPESGDQTDAIRTSIEHADGDPVEVFMPYAKTRMRGSRDTSHLRPLTLNLAWASVRE